MSGGPCPALRHYGALRRCAHQGVPHGLPYGVPHGVPYGMPHGVPYGVPYGMPNGLLFCVLFCVQKAKAYFNRRLLSKIQDGFY